MRNNLIGLSTAADWVRRRRDLSLEICRLETGSVLGSHAKAAHVTSDTRDDIEKLASRKPTFRSWRGPVGSDATRCARRLQVACSCFANRFLSLSLSFSLLIDRCESVALHRNFLSPVLFIFDWFTH